MVTYGIRMTKRFQRDVRRLKRRGYDILLLEDVIEKLASGDELPDKCGDRKLYGMYSGCRECHVIGDWVLAYKLRENESILYLILTSSSCSLY